MARISSSTVLGLAPERGSSVILAVTYRRRRTFAQWQEFHSGSHTAKEFWTEIENATEFRQGDTMIIPGSISDLKDTPCLSYWVVDEVEGSSVHCYASDTFIYSEPGNDGKPGATGIYIPLMRMWEEYPDGYQFQQGNAAAGEVRQDIVLVKDGNGNIVQCACILSHTKAADKKPSPTAVTKYWRPASTSPFMTLETLYAINALIENLTVGGIYSVDADGNIVFRAKGGEVECNKGIFRNVDIYGRLIAGDQGGRHIEIDPGTDGAASMRVYDNDGNECARFSGENYTFQSVMPSGATTAASTTGTGKTMKAAGTSDSAATTSLIASATTSATTVGSLKLSGITVSLSTTGAGNSASTTPGISGDTLMKPEMERGASLYVVVTTLDSSGNIIAESRRYLAAWAERSDGATHIVTVKDKSFTVAVPSGRHRVSFELRATGAEATATVALGQAQFVSDQLMSRFFANGFAVTKNAANYLAVIHENGLMKMRFGGTFDRDGIPQPRIVYAARIADTSSSATAAPTRMELTKLPGVTVGLTKGTAVADGYTMTFPAAYGLTEANTGFRLTGYGGVSDRPTTNPAKATVRSVSVSAGIMTVKIWVSDDDSTNYGGFYIEVLRYD